MMKFEETDQRKKYIDARGMTILTACPGSGKTTSIVYKLGHLQKECRKEYGYYRGIACLSFTNKACAEIEDKYRDMFNSNISYPDIVSTIDSFITEVIVKSNWYLCKILKTKPMVVNDKSIIHGLFLAKSGSAEINICGFKDNFAKLLHDYDPAEIDIGINCFYFNNKKLDSKYNEYAKAVILYRMKKGLCNSIDITWIAAYILCHYKNIAQAIAQRYPYLIVDEAQDTSQLQCLVIKKLIDNGLKNVEYVGDVYQSIYEWRQASPQHFENMMTDPQWNVLHFTENRRSVQHIIDVFSRLRKKTDPLITSHNVENKNIPVIVYKYDDTNINIIINDFQNICKRYNLDNYHVLARGNDFIRHYNGAVEEVKYWKSNIPYLLIKALQSKECGKYPKSIKYLLHVRAELTIKGLDFRKKKEQILKGYEDVATKAQMIDILENLPSMDESFTDWTQKAQNILKEKLGLDKVCFDSFSRKKQYDMNILKNEPISKYYRQDSSCVMPFSIETIHSSKGLSYGGVLLVLSSNSKGQNLSLNSFKNVTPLTEKQRMLYVACSRAEQFLAFAVPLETSNMTIKKLLGVKDEQIKSLGLQLNLF